MTTSTMPTQENDIRMICRDEMYALSVLWISSPGRLGEIETEKQFREPSSPNLRSSAGIPTVGTPHQPNQDYNEEPKPMDVSRELMQGRHSGLTHASFPPQSSCSVARHHLNLSQAMNQTVIEQSRTNHSSDFSLLTQEPDKARATFSMIFLLRSTDKVLMRSKLGNFPERN